MVGENYLNYSLMVFSFIHEKKNIKLIDIPLNTRKTTGNDATHRKGRFGPGCERIDHSASTAIGTTRRSRLFASSRMNKTTAQTAAYMAHHRRRAHNNVVRESATPLRLSSVFAHVVIVVFGTICLPHDLQCCAGQDSRLHHGQCPYRRSAN